MSGKLSLVWGLLVSCLWFSGAEAGSLISYFTVNGQSGEVNVEVNAILRFETMRVETVANPSWTIVGRNTGTNVLFGGTLTSKTLKVEKTATCAYNDIFDCTATLGGQTETLSVRVKVNNCAGTTANNAANPTTTEKNSGITVNASILTLVAALAHVTLHRV